jgi:predicted nuclease of restriction endonuclease-like (RecB) superfamily
MSDDLSVVSCLTRIQQILAQARHRALQTVNAAMVAAYWHVGREIVEEEQRGQDRAGYGERLMRELSANLTREFGKGFSVTNLQYIRQFYLTYLDRVPEIHHSPSGESRISPSSVEVTDGTAISSTASHPGFQPELSWTHYRVLVRVGNSAARSFYEAECAKARWSVRELERQIASLLYERLAMSRDKEGLLALAEQGHEVQRPEDLVKDPYVLEFTGLPEAARWQESDLESALIERLQQFLLELGRDLFFVARQQRITLEGDHFHIDLVFYHRMLRCFLLIDLKVGKLAPQDIGQMLLYTGYYEAEEMRQNESPPVGLILCTDKNDAVVRYTLSQSAQKVFASRYQLHLPTEEELARELRRERAIIDQQRDDELELGPPTA